MLSVGFCVAGRFDGSNFQILDPDHETFYRELKPISNMFDPDALKVAHLDRQQLINEGVNPVDATNDAAAWVRSVAAEDHPVVVAFPASFDWLFLYWYFVKFAEHGSPFSFSSCLDMKSMLVARARVVMDDAGLNDLPEALLPDRPHTHNALDDAQEQAEIFQRLWSWNPT